MANGTKVDKGPVATQDFIKNNSLSSGKDSVLFTEGPSLTRQEFAEECDINRLMARYDTHVHGGPGGLPPMVGQEHMFYADFTDMPTDLMGYMEYMDRAQSSFMTLPAVVRKEFENSAMQFVEFASDPANLDQMRSWGLAPPKKEDPVAVTPTPAAPPPAPDAPK